MTAGQFSLYHAYIANYKEQRKETKARFPLPELTARVND